MSFELYAFYCICAVKVVSGIFAFFFTFVLFSSFRQQLYGTLAQGIAHNNLLFIQVYKDVFCEIVMQHNVKMNEALFYHIKD